MEHGMGGKASAAHPAVTIAHVIKSSHCRTTVEPQVHVEEGFWQR